MVMCVDACPGPWLQLAYLSNLKLTFLDVGFPSWRLRGRWGTGQLGQIGLPASADQQNPHIVDNRVNMNLVVRVTKITEWKE